MIACPDQSGEPHMTDFVGLASHGFGWFNPVIFFVKILIKYKKYIQPVRNQIYKF